MVDFNICENAEGSYNLRLNNEGILVGSISECVSKMDEILRAVFEENKESKK